MASGTRSSKRKSSPSIRKKRRIKDRSKKRSKTVKRKSKKVCSPDSYSDDESLSSGSSVSYSSSDSDDIRRSRSRTKKKSRGTRLRSRSNEGRGKRSSKKKKSIRKKRKREPSISSSDRSVSCSTCRSSDDSEGENRKTEKKSRRDFVDYRRWGDHRSPCRLDGVDDGSYLNFVENNPRRLRSIIIFAKEFEEEEKGLVDRDLHKEEIICDQDDYPSPRSNDSPDYLEVQHEKIVAVLDSNDVCEPNVSSATDLEAVLRQKALENLKKFKGGKRPNAKKSIDGEMKLLNKDEEGNAAAKILPVLTQDSKLVNSSEEGNLKEEKLAGQGLGKDSVDDVKDKHEAASITEESCMTMSVPIESKDVVESVQPCSNDAKLVSNDIKRTPTEMIDPPIVSNLEGQSSNTGDSQFQQKTMSVMRGGEMVQVNYKVYIPNRAPALARRKLKR